MPTDPYFRQAGSETRLLTDKGVIKMPNDPYFKQKNTTGQAVPSVGESLISAQMCSLVDRIKDVENEVGLLEERFRWVLTPGPFENLKMQAVEPCGFSLGQALSVEVERLISIMERLKSLNHRCEL